MVRSKPAPNAVRWIAPVSSGLLFAVSFSGAVEVVVDVRDCGAVGDGKTLCTAAIQQAVDTCAAKGGGTVRLPAGRWLTGTVYLESNVTLLLERNCTLLGSRDIKDYAGPRAKGGGATGEGFRYAAILAGSKLSHVVITGDGTIDGQGSAFGDKSVPRPKAIYLVGCLDVLVEKIHMRSAGSWMQHYRDCDQVTLRGIHVFNHATFNNDGLNVDSCRDVNITGCRVDSDDDGIVLKSLSVRPCERVTVRDCVVSSHCNGIKMGTESGGGFKKVTVADCKVHSPRESKKINGSQRGLAGIALEIVDGGALDDVKVSNVAIDGVSVPIFLRLGNRARIYVKLGSKPDVGTFRKVVLQDITAVNCSKIGCSITGLPGHPIEDVTLSNVALRFEGGGNRKLASREVPERPESYPESTMFGDLPAFGFYCRHARGLKFRDLRLKTATPDLRHAVVFDDVEDLTIDGLDATCSAGAAAIIRLTQVRAATICGCTAPRAAEAFLRVEGGASKQVELRDNDLSGAKKAVDAAPEVPSGAVSQAARGGPL
jgi:polygalacturonase